MALVLFVCSGNVGRSQVAEAYFKYLTQKHKTISAATKYDGAREISPTFKLLLEKEGVSTAGQKPKPLTPDLVEQADCIIVMCSRTECPIYLLKSNKATFWPVRDVMDAEAEDKARVQKEIKALVVKLVAELG